jgi:hypothetical protein
MLHRTHEKGPRTRFAGLFNAHLERRAFSDFQAAARCALMAERVRTMRLNMGFSGSGYGDAIASNTVHISDNVVILKDVCCGAASQLGLRSALKLTPLNVVFPEGAQRLSGKTAVL